MNSEKEILQTNLDELRRHFDSVTNGFDRLRSKALALLVAELAVVTFLFTSDGSIQWFPNQLYGAVFLGIGIVLLVLAFILALWVVSPATWMHPPDTVMARDLKRWFDNDPIKYLEYLNKEYIAAIHLAIKIVSRRATLFTWVIFSLSGGVFIVTMIKFGGRVLNP